MKPKNIFLIGWIVVLIISLNPGNAFCELKSLDDAELSSVEAEGVTVNDANNSSDVAENSGVLSVTAGASDPLDNNDPNRAANVLRPQTANNNAIAASQNQFNSSNQPKNCCTSGVPMPGCH